MRGKWGIVFFAVCALTAVAFAQGGCTNAFGEHVSECRVPETPPGGCTLTVDSATYLNTDPDPPYLDNRPIHGTFSAYRTWGISLTQLVYGIHIDRALPPGDNQTFRRDDGYAACLATVTGFYALPGGPFDCKSGGEGVGTPACAGSGQGWRNLNPMDPFCGCYAAGLGVEGFYDCTTPHQPGDYFIVTPYIGVVKPNASDIISSHVCWTAFQITDCNPGEEHSCNTGQPAACADGHKFCQPNGTWGACQRITDPVPETCNYVDDDCDGSIDEDGACKQCDPSNSCCDYYGCPTDPSDPYYDSYHTVSCTIPGTCSSGTQTCIDNGKGGSCGSYGDCVPNTTTATTEICDGLDNDCDGIVDPDCICLDGDTQICGTDQGICKSGFQICTDNTWGPCQGAVGPRAETCNYQDDDCDGISDNGVVCDWQICTPGTTQNCGTDNGACTAGTQTCSADGKSWGTCVGSTPAQAEVCNGVDDDCDNWIDEEIPPGVCTVTGAKGVCATGTRICLNGSNTCLGQQPGTELCANDLDDDCDGLTDEGCGPCVDGQTASCTATINGNDCSGIQTCAGGVFGACVNNDPNPLCTGTACVNGSVTSCMVQINGNDCAGSHICVEGTYGVCIANDLDCGNPNGVKMQIQTGRMKNPAQDETTLTPNDLTPSDKFNNTDTLGILVLINPPKQLTTTGTLTFSAPDQTPKNLNINAPANRTTTLPAKYDLTGTPPGIYTLTINLNRPAGFETAPSQPPIVRLQALNYTPTLALQNAPLSATKYITIIDNTQNNIPELEPLFALLVVAAVLGVLMRARTSS